MRIHLQNFFRISWCFFVLTAIRLIALPVSGSALEIVYPAEQAAVRHSDYLIIDVAEVLPLDAVTVMVNDVPSDLFDISGDEYRQQFGDILILLPEFDLGENRILVEGYRNGEVVKQARATIYLLGTREEIPPEGFEIFVMHTPDREAKCAGCHYKFDYTAHQLENNMIVEESCGACHSRTLITAEHVHGPAGAFECFTCHDTDSKPSKYMIRPGDAELCIDCHSDQQDAFQSKKHIHGPVAAGSCLICHDPHASAHPAQLLKPVNTLCMECHEGVKEEGHVIRGVSGRSHPLAGKPDPSRPGRLLDCSGCHDPHAGSGSSYLKGGVSSAMALCQRCHKK